MKNRLSRHEMAAQLREEAAELIAEANRLIQMAITLEGNADPQPTIAEKRALTTADVVKAMGGKNARKASIADALGVDISELDGLMTPENGFKLNEKGWWSHGK